MLSLHHQPLCYVIAFAFLDLNLEATRVLSRSKLKLMIHDVERYKQICAAI